MARHYVDVTGVPDDFFEAMGYCLFEENDEFQIRVCKGESYILPKQGKRYLYVEDMNDAIIFRNRPQIPAPPKPSAPKKRRHK